MKNTPQTRGDRGTVELVELLEFAIEQANDGIAIMKFTGQPDSPIRIVYANETIERLSGFSREELLEPSSPFLQIQPQNRALYEALFIDVRAGKPVQFEVELGGKNRSTWTEIRWSPLRYGRGEVTHYVAYCAISPSAGRHKRNATSSIVQSSKRGAQLPFSSFPKATRSADTSRTRTTRCAN